MALVQLITMSVPTFAGAGIVLVTSSSEAHTMDMPVERSFSSDEGFDEKIHSVAPNTLYQVGTVPCEPARSS